MTQQMEVKLGTLIEYPEYDRAWIAWITQSSYLIMKIKYIYNKNGEIEIGDLFSKLEVEWILKTDFNYKILNKPNKRKRI